MVPPCSAHSGPDLYFGYGSNLDQGDWSRFCRRHGFDPAVLRPVRSATLPDEILVFDYHSNTRQCGALNIRHQPGSAIDGYLFAVANDGWSVLDVKEGAPQRYRRETITVIDGTGRKTAAQTYRVVESLRQGFVAPNAAYLAACHAGRALYGLSIAPLKKAAAGGV